MHELSKTEAGWTLKLPKYRLELDSSNASLVSLSLNSADDAVGYMLQIEAPFNLHLTDGRELTYNPSAELARSQELVGTDKTGVREIVMSNTGTLTIEFENGSSLHVEGSADYEPWNLSGSDGFRTVSTPESSLSVWLPGQ